MSDLVCIDTQVAKCSPVINYVSLGSWGTFNCNVHCDLNALEIGIRVHQDDQIYHLRHTKRIRSRSQIFFHCP